MNAERVNPEGKRFSFNELYEGGIKYRSNSSGQVRRFNFGGFRPFVHQLGMWLELKERGENFRKGMAVLPRRSGKSVFLVVKSLMKGIEKAYRTDLRFLKYGILFPDLTNAKEAALDPMDEYSEGLPEKNLNQTTGQLSFSMFNQNRKRITVRLSLIGLQNFDRRRGRGFDGVAGDERGYMTAGFKAVTSPMLTDAVRQPTWELIAGTPTEDGDFWDSFDGIREKEKLGDMRYWSVWSNYEKLRHVSEESYQLATEDMSPEEIAIEWGCRRGVKLGARFFNIEMKRMKQEGRFREILEDKSQKKFITCDIGGTTTKTKDVFSLVYWQRNRLTGNYQAIKYSELVGVDEEVLFNEIQGTGYNIGQIFLPWDGAVGVNSTQDILKKLFPMTEVRVLQRLGRKITGIRLLRRFLGNIEMDKLKCATLGEHAQRYSKVWDKNKRIYLVEARHDKHSHGVDACIVAAQADNEGHITDDKVSSLERNLKIVHLRERMRRFDTTGSYFKAGADIGELEEEIRRRGLSWH